MKLYPVVVSYLRLPIVLRLVLLTLATITVFGALIHFVEPQNFTTLYEGIWWAIITVSTVGYGDFSPTTSLGRSVGILLILGGTGFMTFYFASIAAATVTRQNSFLDGMSTYNGKKHIILVGWNERIRETINQLQAKKRLPIVLVDETLKQNPVTYSNVTFIKGNPTHDDTLERANIMHAEIIIISADQSKNEIHSDMSTILTLVTAKGLNPDLYTIVEMLTKKQISNASRAGANEIIQTNKLTSSVMTNSIVSNGMSETLLDMLDNLAGNNLEYLLATAKNEGLTYQECLNKLISENILVIGIKRGEESYINPPPTFQITEFDELLVIRH
ncbi:potassium channel family protein [Bacillus sp. DJP31]|uniref:potassium channel family protein n=1 Tax=Bacillus sp. DJP31 TaxID=3409789 RepID=UPI003BB6A567